MKTVDVEMLRKRYLSHAEMKASEEIDSVLRDLEKYDYPEGNVFTKNEVIDMLMELFLLFEDCKSAEECQGILNKKVADLEGEK